MGPSASFVASVVPSMYCMVKKGWSSHTPACKHRDDIGVAELLGGLDLGPEPIELPG